MFVIKRDGRKEPVHFDKITARIMKLSYGLNPDFCDPVSPPPRAGISHGVRWQQGISALCSTSQSLNSGCSPQRYVLAEVFKLVLGSRRRRVFAQVLVAQKVTMGVYKGVTTSELDELAAETAASLTATHPDYALVRRGHAAPGPLPPLPRPLATLSQRHSTGKRRSPPLIVCTCPVPQLAARIAVSNLHKSTLKSFSETCALGPCNGAYGPLDMTGLVGCPLSRTRNAALLPLASQSLAQVLLQGRGWMYEPCADGIVWQVLAMSRIPVACCRVKVMYNHVNKKNGEAAPLVSEELYNIVMAVRCVLLCTRRGASVQRRCGHGQISILLSANPMPGTERGEIGQQHHLRPRLRLRLLRLQGDPCPPTSESSVFSDQDRASPASWQSEAAMESTAKIHRA